MAICVLSLDGTVRSWNAGARRQKHFSAEQIVGKNFAAFYTDADRGSGMPQRDLARTMAHGRLESDGMQVRRDGTTFHAHVAIDPIYDDHRTHVGFAHVTRDLTGSMRQIARLETTRDNFGIALEHMSQGLCLFDDRECIVVCNDSFRELLAIAEGALEIGSTYTDLMWLLLARDGASPEDVGDQVDVARRNLHARSPAAGAKLTELKVGGRIIVMKERAVPQGGWIATVDDVTERREMEREVTHLAHHDALTDLPNRAVFQRHLADGLGRANRRAFCALLYIDLDRFKRINDSYGHHVGDEVLRIAARRIRENTRPRDMVARLGGDEFAMFCQDMNDRNAALGLAERITRDLAGVMDLSIGACAMSASIGVAIAAPSDMDPDALMRHADLAMYAAKAAGRGRCMLYRPGMRARAVRGRPLETTLRETLESHGFSLAYQPVVDTRSARVVSFEALLRWHHPARGTVAPAAFIPVAEEIGLMSSIDDWVLRTACRDALSWPDDVLVSVNLSAASLHESRLVETIRNVLDQSGIAPERLEIELTEASIMADLPHARAVLSALGALGVKIAMDDFGTGHASLGLLRDIAFSRIKIDRRFIGDIGESDDSVAIVRAIVGMCATLGIPVTAEGVETRRQADILRREHCIIQQGRLIAAPMRSSAIPDWMSAFFA